MSFGLFALGDVAENNRDFMLFRLVHRESVQIEPEPHRFGTVDPPFGLYCFDDFSESFRPVRLNVWHQLADGFANCVFERGDVQESRISFKKAVVNCLSGIVE
ncbi:MAG: hypothetical protein V7K56_04365 [Nostoc sp.]